MPVIRVTLGSLSSIVAGRVQNLCRGQAETSPRRIPILVRSVAEAVLSQLPDDHKVEDSVLRDMTNAQLDLLAAAIDSLPRRLAEEKARSRRPRHRPPQAEGDEHAPIAVKSFEEKLADHRVFTQKMLNEDCVQLGLLSPERATQLCINLTGKTLDKAEGEIIAELRNILHGQVQAYIKELKGGPWKNLDKREQLRMEIDSTRSIKSVLNITRQVLKERDHWIEEFGGGKPLHNLLKGKIKFTKRPG